MVKKHLEVVSYEYQQIEIMVQIDFDAQKISLVEKEWSDNCASKMPDSKFKIKLWNFSNRGLEYMYGWDNILNAMQYAIGCATKELKDYIEEVEKDKVKQTIKNIKQGAREAKKK